jgi:hypothetical protein
MPHPDSPMALLDARAVAPSPRAMQHAFLWILASLVTASGLLGLGYALSERSEREAGRMIVAAQGGNGYLAVVVSGFAAGHGHPSR